MPIFDVEFNDGTIVPVEAPRGTSESEIARLATQQLNAGAKPAPTALASPAAAFAEQGARRSRAQDLADVEARLAQLREYNRRKESGFLENILSGFGAGAVGVGELAALGGAALLDEEQELRARDAIKETAEAFRPDSGDPESIAYKLASGLGSIAGFAAPAALAAAAAPASAAAAVGLGTAGALGAGAGAGEARERAREAGLTGEELTSPTLKGFGVGTLEIAPVVRPLAALGRALRIPGLGAVGERLATKIDAESVAGRLAQRAKSAGVTGTAEGAQEASAAILQNLIERGYNPEKELVDAGVLEEGLIGGGAGAILQGLADFLVRGRPRGAAPDTEGRGEGEQLELFPGEDLGTRPALPEAEPEDREAQLEMFTEEEMGRPPERPDERQMGLFGVQEPDLTDSRLERAQGALQFAPDAPAGRRFTEEEPPISPAMPEAMAPIARQLEFERAEAERAAQLEAEREADLNRIEAEAMRQRQLELAEQDVEAPVRTLDDALFDELDIPKAAGVRKKYKGRTTDDAEVLEALRSYARNPNTKPERRAKVRRFLAGQETAPSGPIAAVPEPVGEPAGAVEGAEPTGVGVSPADGGPELGVGPDGGDGGVGVGPEGGPAVAQAPDAGAVEGDGVPAAEAVDGEGVQSDPLGATTVTPDTVLDAAVMDALGIPKTLTVIRGLIEKRKVSDPGVVQTLEMYRDFSQDSKIDALKDSAAEVDAAIQRIKGISAFPLEGQGELFPDADLGTAPARPAEPEAGVEEGPSPQQQLFDTAGQPIVPPAPPAVPTAEPATEPTPEATTPPADAEPATVPRWKQALGEPPKWATLVGEDYVGEVVYVNGDVGLFRGYKTSSGEYNYLPIKKTTTGVQFGKVDVTLFTGNMLTDAEKQQLINARNEIEFQEDLKEAQNPNGPFAEGEQLAFSTNFPRDLAQIATQWARLLGIQDRVFFATKEDLRSLEELEKRNLYGSFGGPVRSLGYRPDRVLGSTRVLVDSSGARLGHVLFIQVRKNKTATLETLAHEMGHILEEEAFASAPEETRQAIINEYERWLETKDEKNAATWVRELRAHVGGRLEVRRDPSLKDEKATDLTPYWRSFSEYFADQVSKWAVSSERPITVVEQFFARIAAALRRLYSSLAGKASLPNAEMKKYLDSRAPSESPLTAANLPTAPPTGTGTTETIKEPAPKKAPPKAEAPKPAPKKAPPKVKPAPKPKAAETKQTDAENFARIKKAKADTLSPDEQALQKYTGNESMDIAVESAVSDLFNNENSVPKGSKISLLVMRWVRQNGSPDLNAKLDAEIARAVKERPLGTQRKLAQNLASGLKRSEFDLKELVAKSEQLNMSSSGDVLKLVPEVVTGLDMPMHPATKVSVQEGNLLDALRSVGDTHPVQQLASMAKKFADRVGNTKLQLVANLKDAAGNPVAGLFDPKTNTIKLDRDSGVNLHTFMHETAHALTSANLAKKGHPTTQALNKLFDDVKDSLDTAYGAQSLDEFIAEAFSNPTFQARLHTINVKGEKVTAWNRFVGAVANFFRSLMGLDTKPVTAQDQITQLTDALLAPSPETRNAGALYMASQAGKGGEVLSSLYENAPVWNKEAAATLRGFVDRLDVRDGAKKLVLDFLPLNYFADFVGDRMPEAKKLDEIVRLQSAMLEKMLDKTMPTVDKVAKWFKSEGRQNITVDGITMDKGTALNDAAHVGSYEGVNPTYDESRYKGTEKFEAYKYVKRRYDKLGPDGQAAYRSVLNTYKYFKDQIGEALEIALKDAVPNSKSRLALVKELYNRLIAEGGIDPYVAFDREGKFWLEYNAIDPRTGQSEYFLEAFDTKAARKRAANALQAQKDKIQLTGLNMTTSIAETNYNNAPSGSFVREVLDVLEANEVKGEVKDNVMRLFLEYLPEKSVAQSFQFRKGPGGKGIRGMKGDITPLSVNMPRHDVIDVLQRRVPILARQISQLRYNREVQKLVSEAEERVKTQGKTDEDVRDLAQLQGRAKFVQNPTIANWSKRITSSIFAMTIGANPSSALLQTSQIPLVVAPLLAARKGVGLGKTTKAFGNAVRAFTASGFSRKTEMIGPDGNVVERTKAMPSIDNFDFDGPKPAHMSDEYWKKLRVLAEVGADHNVLGRSIAQDMVELDESRGFAAMFNRYMAFMFHNSEKMTKQVALMMAYEVELDGNKNPSQAQMEEAALKAIEFVEFANGSAAQAGAAPFAQNDYGRVVYMYKRYGVSMLAVQFKLFNEAFVGATPEVKSLARRQMLGTWVAAGLMSGALGLPMMGVVRMLYDAFAEDDEDDFDTVATKSLGSLPARGALNYLLGVDVASRVQMTDLLFREPLIENESFLWEMIMTFGGPAVGIANNFERGVEQMLEGNVGRGFEAMAPAAVRNVVRAGRYYAEGAQTLRGDPVLDDVGATHVALQALGFAPAEYIRQMEINQNAKRIDRAVSTKRSKLMKQYYLALRMGDSGGAQDIMNEIQKFNARNPDYPITTDSLKRSLRSHIRTSQRMHHGVTYSPRLQNRLIESMADYEGSVSIWD